MPSTNGSARVKELRSHAASGSTKKLFARAINFFVRKPKPALPVSDDPTKPGSGDVVLDFMLKAGPRVFTPELATKEVRLAIAKSSALGPYRDALKDLAQRQVALIHAEIARVSRENREIEKHSKACRAFIPYYRKPLLLHAWMEVCYGEGCWADEDFVEDVLKHHPGLRINVKRGIRGQEYAGSRR
jgi:hypothetical protein